MKNYDKTINFFIKNKIECVLLLMGVVLMVFSGVLEKNNDKSINNQNPVYSDSGDNSCNMEDISDYQKKEEDRLACFLSTVEGVGNAEVIIYVDESEMIVNATEKNNSVSVTDETDSNGGTRKNNNSDESITYKTIKDSNGNESVVPICTEYPEIVGIVISAEGAGSNIIKEKIMNAVQTLYSIPVHKIEVLEKIK